MSHIHTYTYTYTHTHTHTHTRAHTHTHTHTHTHANLHASISLVSLYLSSHTCKQATKAYVFSQKGSVVIRSSRNDSSRAQHWKQLDIIFWESIEKNDYIQGCVFANRSEDCLKTQLDAYDTERVVVQWLASQTHILRVLGSNTSHCYIFSPLGKVLYSLFPHRTQV